MMTTRRQRPCAHDCRDRVAGKAKTRGRKIDYFHNQKFKTMISIKQVHVLMKHAPTGACLHERAPQLVWTRFNTRTPAPLRSGSEWVG